MLESLIVRVCRKSDMTISDALAKTRKREVVFVRHLIMKFAKDVFTTDSLQFIARSLRLKDHSTVIHGIQAVDDMLDTDKVFKNYYENMKQELIDELFIDQIIDEELNNYLNLIK